MTPKTAESSDLLRAAEGASPLADLAIETPPAAAPTAPDGQPTTEEQGEDRLWVEFAREKDEGVLVQRLSAELKKVVSLYPAIAQKYAILSLYLRRSSIGPFEADQVHEALARDNPEKKKDVLLFVVSRGGSVEPAYQISTLCRDYASNAFVAVIPREAKSAATLISLGAHKVHMGPLGELGPIDPQLGGLPALAVEQALRIVAEIASEYPKSASMFADYLRQVVTIEQIGYCQRISQSAVQYAERLLADKKQLPATPSDIANRLVYHYKDHNFVIDRNEARTILGGLVVSESDELLFAERVYKVIFLFDLVLGSMHKKKVELSGLITDPAMLFELRS